MSYNKTDFKKHLQQFIIEGFKNITDDYVFVRSKPDTLMRLIVSNNVYFPNSMVFKTIGTTIIFKNFENIFSNIWKNYFPNIIPNEVTISYVHFGITGIDYSKMQTRVVDDSSFETASSEVKKIIEISGLPFFEKYNNLEAVANLYSTLTPEEVSQYIQGSILFIKAILVLKLTNHYLYETKREEYYNSLISYANQKEEYKKIQLIYENTFYK